MKETRGGVGASVKRSEDARHLFGEGEFVADLRLPGTRDVAFVRSPLAHARVRAVAKPAGHEDEVFTAADLEGVSAIYAPSALPGFKRSRQPVFAADRVRHVGEILAACVASDRAAAEDLAESVALDLEELPAVHDSRQARDPSAPILHDEWGDNVFLESVTGPGLGALRDEAAVSVTRTFRTARQCMSPLEGRAVLAYRDRRQDMLVVRTACQMPHIVRNGLAECLGIEQGRIRVIAPDVGGGFGYKGILLAEEVFLGWLAMRCTHPVRWIEDRREQLTGNANCREHHYVITGHAASDGRLLGIECEAHVDAGAYSAYPFSAGLEPAQVGSILPGPYVFEGYHCRTWAMATNKPPILPYRGVARTGVCFALEVLLDAMARELGMDPVGFRRRNLVRPDQMPFDNITAKHFDSGDYPECLRRAAEALASGPAHRGGTMDGGARGSGPEGGGNGGKPPGEGEGEGEGGAGGGRAAGTDAGRRYVGAGYAVFCEQAAHGTSVYAAWGVPMVPGHEQATARLTPDGGLELRVGVHSHGQGLETTLAQVAHEILGIDNRAVKVVHGDTAYTPYSTGTWGSRCMVMAGGAVAAACEALGGRVRRLAAHLLQIAPDEVELRDGGARGPGGGGVSLADIGRLWYRQPENLPDDVDPRGLEVTEGYRAVRDSGTFSYACHACVVEVDVETGGIEILDYVVVEDGGVLVNPAIVGRPGPWRRRARDRDRALRGDALRRGGAAARLHPRRLPAAGGGGGAGDPDRAHGDALSLQPLRSEGARRGGSDRSAGRDRERDQRRARAARGGGRRAADHARAPARESRAGNGVKAAAFGYSRALSTAHAIDLLVERPGRRLIAGGQSLGPMLNLRLARPDSLVDVRECPELRRFADTPDAVVYGAGITHAEIEDGAVPDPSPGWLRQAARNIAYRAVRNRGTIGGSLAHADPAADWPVVLAALDAEVWIDGPAGPRAEPLASFLRGPFTTSLAPGELLTAVRVPRPSPSARLGYCKLAAKSGEFAQALAVVLEDPDRAVNRAVIGAIERAPIVVESEGPFPAEVPDARALVAARLPAGAGGPVHAAALARAARAARDSGPAGAPLPDSPRSPRTSAPAPASDPASDRTGAGTGLPASGIRPRSASAGSEPEPVPALEPEPNPETLPAPAESIRTPIRLTVNGRPVEADVAPPHPPRRLPARVPPSHRNPPRLRARGVRGVHRPHRRTTGAFVHRVRRRLRRGGRPHRRGLRRGPADERAPRRVLRAPRPAVRLLHAGHARHRVGPRPPPARRGRAARPEGARGEPLPLHRLPGHRRGDWRRPRRRGRSGRRAPSRLPRCRRRLRPD